ncbi:hypothetical protein BgiMline_009992 [Biomphalaria glabrata]
MALALTGAFQSSTVLELLEIRKTLIDPKIHKKSTSTILPSIARETIARSKKDTRTAPRVLWKTTSGYDAVVRFPGAIESEELFGPWFG